MSDVKCPVTLPTGRFKDQVIDKMNEEQESFVVLRPGEEWVPGKKEHKCTCGMEKIGGGIHSDWCDKYEVARDE